MREIKFDGALTPDTFKEFFLIYDALLPLEWRVNYLHGKTIADFGNYFERIICRDDILNLDSWYNDHAQEMYISLLLHKQWHRQIAKLVNNYNFKGVDELRLPVELVAKDRLLLEILLSLKADIRRIDIEIPTHDYKVRDAILEYQEKFEQRKTQFFITSLYDPPAIDSWYSKPNYEGMVDPLPEPYIEDEKQYSITSDGLYYKDGFRLNLQDEVPTQNRRAFRKDFEPYKLLPLLLKKKISYYKECRNSIKLRDGNIYWGYFNWVVKHIKVNTNYNFVPNFMLKPHSFYYQALIEDGIFNHTDQGLLLSPNSYHNSEIITITK